MSNVIKAYSIKYDNEKRLIDTNPIAESYVKRFMEVNKSSIENEKENGVSGEFVQGLAVTLVSEVKEEKEKEEDLLKISEEQMIENNKKLSQNAKEIVEQAKEEVKVMLSNARKEAEQLKKDIYDKAKQEGYQAGKNQATLEIDTIKEELLHEKDQYRKDYENKVKNLEPVFTDLLISYLKRFTGVLLEDKREIVLYLLDQELMNVESSNTYIIRVSREDYDMVNSKKTEIKWKLKENAEIEIVEDRMLSRAQCMIETDSRIIDCSLDVQLKNLISDLKMLAGVRTNP